MSDTTIDLTAATRPPRLVFTEALGQAAARLMNEALPNPRIEVDQDSGRTRLTAQSDHRGVITSDGGTLPFRVEMKLVVGEADYDLVPAPDEPSRPAPLWRRATRAVSGFLGWLGLLLALGAVLTALTAASRHLPAG